MKKSNKKNNTFLLLFIFLLTAVLTICSSFTLAKYTQIKNTGTITLEIKKEDPVLYRGFVDEIGLNTDNTTTIVFDSWDNRKDELGLTDEDWEKNTNFAQEAKNNPTSSDDLCKGIKVFEKENTAYVLAEGDRTVAFPVDSSGMFLNCSNLTSVKFNLIDTGRTTNMLNMFCGCSGLSELDLSAFDTQNVTNISSMFYGCSKLTTLDVSGFDTSNVTDMSSMFHDCSGLTELDLSAFNTSNVSTMEEMFAVCSELTVIDLSEFDTSSVITMKNMFSDCSALRQITLSKDFNFVSSDGYLPDAAEGNCWYVLGDEDIPITPAEIAANQATVTAATTYIQKQELTL